VCDLLSQGKREKKNESKYTSQTEAMNMYRNGKGGGKRNDFSEPYMKSFYL
jgi:hypothetical protein